jgi:shikimate dehydrogenase
VITGNTKVCVIFGDPVAHTLSPAFHAAGYRALGIEHDYTFVAARVTATDLPKAISGARAMNLHAITCTMPHKEAVVRLLDGVDEAAQSIGAVNSIVNRAGRFLGYNTDWLGIRNSLERRRALRGAKVVVLGAGGTARAAVFGLTNAGAEVTILNRSVDRAEALALEFGCAGGDLSAAEPLQRADIVVQTTSVGLSDELANPIPGAPFRADQLVLDVIYRPQMTSFLRAAQSVGATIITGEEVFIEQGIAQFELFTGLTPPRGPLEAVLRSAQ